MPSVSILLPVLQCVDAKALYEAAQDALSIDDFDSARLYLRQAVQLAPQARTPEHFPG